MTRKCYNEICSGSDVIGVCKHRGELQTFTSRNTMKELTKRDIMIVDKTNREVIPSCKKGLIPIMPKIDVNAKLYVIGKSHPMG
jgi:hypothetical protein